MMDGGWEDHLHFGLLGEHVLIAGLTLDSGWSFAAASILTVCICVAERVLTYAISKNWNPFSGGPRRPSRFAHALWRACLHWFVTLARLLYMLIGMTFSIGLIAIAVSTLAFGQFIIEYAEYAPPDRHDTENFTMKEPLLAADEDAYGPEPSPVYPPSRPTLHASRPRSRSKPESIFIHPNHSNLARADAAAANLGIAGDTERVKANTYPADEDAWEHGRGRDVARELLLGGGGSGSGSSR